MSESNRRRDDPVFWLIIFSIGFVGLGLWLLRRDSQADQQRYESNNAKTLAIELCRDLSDATSRVQCVTDSLSAFQQQTYAHEDVKAQQDMAIYSLLMLIVSAAGVVFVARTLDATREALGEAEKATSVAEDSVEVAREIGVAQTRAYITVKDMAIELFDTGTTDFRLILVLSNSGQSPAMNPKARFRAWIEHSPMKGEWKTSEVGLPFGQDVPDVPAQDMQVEFINKGHASQIRRATENTLAYITGQISRRENEKFEYVSRMWFSVTVKIQDVFGGVYDIHCVSNNYNFGGGKSHAGRHSVGFAERPSVIYTPPAKKQG